MRSYRHFQHREAIQAMPVVAMALVVMLLGVLLWLLHRNEMEEEQRTLIQDILWVEQNLHFHLSSDAEKLQELATKIARDGVDPHTLRLQVRALISNNPEFERIVLRDAEGKVELMVPPADGRGGEGDPAWLTTFTLAKSVGRVVYGGPYQVAGRGWVFEAHTPLFRAGRFAGMVIGVFSLDAMLTHHVPWWFAGKYNLEIVDTNGSVLAAKSTVPIPAPGASHQVRFEPPGQGLLLVATVYGSETNLARNVLAAAILGLAMSALWSLWAVRGHIRHRLAAEQALGAEHAFRKAMEDSLTVGMRARDLEGRITYVNPAFCRMVGWSADELVGAGPPMPYWVPEEIDRTLELHQAVLRGDAPSDGFEIAFRRKDGQRFSALVYEAPLIDADNRHTGWMASVLDITERKRAEELGRQQQEKLQHTARLITMGEMASTLAHELNQPLSAIASYNAGCLNRLASGEFQPGELMAALTKLGVQAQRAGQIIRRVHDFVRKSEPAVVPCSINAVVEDSVGFLDVEARKRKVRVELALSVDAPWVAADRILIEQVILNLARNAMEAMGQTPALSRILDVSVQSLDGQTLVRLADRGSGVPPEVAEMLFTPFYTTKDQGMGMGLNICRSIIELHQGRLWFEPNPGGGSVFLFTLPERVAA
jgi:two-component system, LuxR family, sensor histidine kinase DctS